jgi:hypothetical protein
MITPNKYSIALVTLNNLSDVSARIRHNEDKIMYLVPMPLRQSLPEMVAVYQQSQHQYSK